MSIRDEQLNKILFSVTGFLITLLIYYQQDYNSKMLSELKSINTNLSTITTKSEVNSLKIEFNTDKINLHTKQIDELNKKSN